MTDHTYLLEPEDAPSKREILVVALHLFVREGLCETSIRDIAERTGYTNPALYKFFASKDALALHLFERCYLRMYDRIVSATEGVRYPESVRAFATEWCALADEDLESMLFVNENLRAFWPRVRPQIRRKSLIRHLTELLAPSKCDPSLATSIVLGTCGQLARLRFFEHGASIDPKQLANLFLNGLSARGAT